MRTDASLHRRSNPQGLMNAPEVVPHVPDRDHVRVVLNLLAERIGEPGKATHTHSHVEVLPFDVRSRNVLGVRVASHGLRDCADTSRGAVSGIAFKVAAIDLDEHGIVDSRTERIANGGQVHPMAVRGQLNAIRQSRLNVLKERRRKPRVSLSYHPIRACSHYAQRFDDECK